MDSRSRGGSTVQIGGMAARQYVAGAMLLQCGTYENHGWMSGGGGSEMMMQECNMCGDVGFPDQLQHCSACRSRVQHTYCSTSMEGTDSGCWICDWCRVAKQAPGSRNERQVEGIKESLNKQPLSNTSHKEHALELLLKAALAPPGTSELASPRAKVTDPVMQDSPVADCGSNCSSSLESEKLMSLNIGSHSCNAAEASSSCENQVVLDMNISDEEGSLGIVPQVQINGSSSCDIRRSPKSLLRCSVQVRSSKMPKQKSLPGLRNHGSSSSIPVPLMKLTSFKSMPRTKSVAIIESPKGLVRRYKSLSDISY